jgi:TonB-linked SusC/RagA family outer membrane protein
MQNFTQNNFSAKNVCRKLMFALFSLLFASFPLFAQSISGKVTAKEDGSAVPGANVLVKGTTTGTITGIDGMFKISLSKEMIEQFGSKEKVILLISYVGYLSQEITVGNQSEINVVLEADLKQLQEVVVTALGIAKEKKALGYSVQEVKGGDLIKAREPNPINSLTGKVAGLTIAPSAEMLRRPQVILRGSDNVLYVVDGVPINSDTWNISADDIESYTVLKGANASALYGFRGKNGAILITTKRGSRDKRGFSVEFNSSIMMDRGFIAIPEVQDMYGPGDHGVYEFVDGRGGGKNDGDYDVWGPKLDGRLLPQYDSPIDPVTGKRIPTPWIPRGKDNLKRFIRTGVLSNNNVAVSSSGQNYDLRFSVSHGYQRGIVPNTQLNITNFNTSLGYNFSSKLRFESNINYNRQYTPNFPDINYGPNSLVYNMVTWGGADWNVDDMRNYWQPGKEGIQQIYAEYQRYNNPYFTVYEWLRGHYKTDVYGTVSLKYKINDFMEVTGRTQVTTYDLFRNEKFPYSATTYGREEARGDYREDKRNLFENNTDILIKFDKKVTPALDVKAWVGGNLRTWNYNSSYTTTNYLNIPGLYRFDNSRNPLVASSYASKMQVASAYYSLDLSYKGYVNVSTTGRVDKLSTLPSQSNTYFYPSVSVSTPISDYVKLPEAISFLKVRGSFANVKDGLTQAYIGATQFASYPIGYGENYQSSYDGPSYANAGVYSTSLIYNNQPAAFFTNTLNNPNLQPNSTSIYEGGLEMKFLENRLGLDVTYFVSNDGPRIFNLPLSQTTGYTSQLVNGIKTQKKGMEIALTGTALKNDEGLNWEITANWSYFREYLRDIYPGISQLPSNYFVGGGSGNNFINIGDRTDKFFGSAFVRTPDGQIVNDAGGRPIVNPVGQFLGFTNPDWVWGLNNRFSYKNFTFSFQFDGRVGGNVVNYIQQQTFRGGRHIATVEGAMGIAREEDTRGNRTWLGEGVQVANGARINYDVLGNVTNYGELQFKPNETKQFLQDYISRYYNTSEGNLMSRSYAKLREVVIGYNLPQSLLSKTPFKMLSISFVGRNLLYFAEKKDIDLDQFAWAAEGRSSFQTPTMRRYGFNLNIVF